MSASVARTGIPAQDFPSIINPYIHGIGVESFPFICFLICLSVGRFSPNHSGWSWAPNLLPQLPVLGSQTCATTPNSEMTPIISYLGLRAKMTWDTEADPGKMGHIIMQIQILYLRWDSWLFKSCLSKMSQVRFLALPAIILWDIKAHRKKILTSKISLDCVPICCSPVIVWGGTVLGMGLKCENTSRWRCFGDL